MLPPLAQYLRPRPSPIPVNVYEAVCSIVSPLSQRDQIHLRQLDKISAHQTQNRVLNAHLGNYTVFDERAAKGEGPAGRAQPSRLWLYPHFPPRFVRGVVELYHGLRDGDRKRIVNAYTSWGFHGLNDRMVTRSTSGRGSSTRRSWTTGSARLPMGWRRTLTDGARYGR